MVVVVVALALNLFLCLLGTLLVMGMAVALAWLFTTRNWDLGSSKRVWNTLLSSSSCCCTDWKRASSGLGWEVETGGDTVDERTGPRLNPEGSADGLTMGMGLAVVPRKGATSGSTSGVVAKWRKEEMLLEEVLLLLLGAGVVGGGALLPLAEEDGCSLCVFRESGDVLSWLNLDLDGCWNRLRLLNRLAASRLNGDSPPGDGDAAAAAAGARVGGGCGAAGVSAAADAGGS